MSLILSGTDGLSDVDGSAATPAIRGTDANTGIFFPAADTIAFSEGGAEAMRIDASGNVGIGTASPAYKLDVATAGQTVIQIKAGTTTDDSILGFGDSAANLMGRVNYSHNGDSMSFFTNGSQKMLINSSGNVGIGTSSPASKLHVDGAGPQLRLSGSGYVVNPTEFVLGQYDSLTGYVQVPGSGKFDVWNNSTGVIARFNNNGSVSISGSLSKGSGSFRISHPLPELAETHELVHSFIEGPQADNIYRGKVALVNGLASVNIDTASGMTEGTFVLLNREVQCFTTNETGWVHVRGSVTGNLLTIEAQDNTCTDTISWMAIGERKDKHMYDTDWTDENGKVIVEPIKQVERSPAEEAEQE